MSKYCRLCGLPFEPVKSNQIYCDYCRLWMRNINKKPHTEAVIEGINQKASALGLSYGQMVQKYKL